MCQEDHCVIGLTSNLLFLSYAFVYINVSNRYELLKIKYLLQVDKTKKNKSHWLRIAFY